MQLRESGSNAGTQANIARGAQHAKGVEVGGKGGAPGRGHVDGRRDREQVCGFAWCLWDGVNQV